MERWLEYRSRSRDLSDNSPLIRLLDGGGQRSGWSQEGLEGVSRSSPPGSGSQVWLAEQVMFTSTHTKAMLCGQAPEHHILIAHVRR